MNKVLLLVISQFCLFSLTLSQTIKGNGNIVREDRRVGAFNSIDTRDGWDLLLSQGNEYGITVETDENLMEYVRTEVQGSTLKIYTDAKIMKSNRRRILVTFRDLRSIKASGGADVDSQGKISTGDFDINCSGGSDLSLEELSCSAFSGDFSGGSDVTITFSAGAKIHIDARGGSDIHLRDISGSEGKFNLSGGSDATLSGKLDDMRLSGSGGSDVSASNLEIGKAIISLSGSSDGKFNVLSELDLTLNGGSDFTCKGDPEIVRQVVCKSCDVRL